MYQYIWQYKSDLAIHGAAFAAKQLARKNVPVSIAAYIARNHKSI